MNILLPLTQKLQARMSYIHTYILKTRQQDEQNQQEHGLQIQTEGWHSANITIYLPFI
jgi:hypothetical protein